MKECGGGESEESGSGKFVMKENTAVLGSRDSHRLPA